MEGFPNVFIEAWACGIPVLSLHVDPGNVIENEGLGFAARGNMDKLVEAMDNLDHTDSFALKSKRYIKMTHELNPLRVAELNTIFTRVRSKQ
jgi:glycosyltransferase involved in cell wall biosynthesis